MSEPLTARDINQAIREGKTVMAYPPGLDHEAKVFSARASLYDHRLQVSFGLGTGFYNVEPRMVRILEEK